MDSTNESAIPYLQTALRVNTELLGLPILPLIVTGCLGLACLLFALPTFPNRWIPSATILWGLLLNVVATPPTTMLEFVRSMIFGLVAGVVAWIMFKKFGIRWLTPSTFTQNGDTEIVKKDGKHEQPPLNPFP